MDIKAGAASLGLSFRSKNEETFCNSGTCSGRPGLFMPYIVSYSFESSMLCIRGRLTDTYDICMAYGGGIDTQTNKSKCYRNNLSNQVIANHR